jgi:hypothetical protein
MQRASFAAPVSPELSEADRNAALAKQAQEAGTLASQFAFGHVMVRTHPAELPEPANSMKLSLARRAGASAGERRAFLLSA